MNLALSTIFAILRQIVIDMGKEPGLQLNTYSEVDEQPDMASISLGKTFSDYKHGYFWSRSWVYGGAKSTEIKAEYPVVFAQLQSSKPKSLTSNEDTHTINLVLVDKLDCPSCPPSLLRTGPHVSANLRRMARALLQELGSYKLYEVTRDGATTYEWASDGRAEYWESEGISASEIDDIDQVIDEAGIEMRKWGNTPGYRGLLLTIPFRLCEPTGVRFRYDDQPITALSSNDCPC